MFVTADDISEAFEELDKLGRTTDAPFDKMIIQKRWNGKIKCPFCNNERYYHLSSRQYKCANNKCYKKFSITSGTVLENIKMSKIDFFCFVSEVLTEKEGNTIVFKNGERLPKEDYSFSPMSIVYDWGYTYRTAWKVLQKIRFNVIGDKFYLYK